MSYLDIILVNAHQARTSKLIALTTGMTAPLGITYIASYLRKHGFNVKILDNDIEQFDGNQFKHYINSNKPRCVAISSLTNSINNAFLLAAVVKTVDPDIPVVFGGAHATSLPEQSLLDQAVDVVVRGEGEETMLELLDALIHHRPLTQIVGITYKDHGQACKNPDREYIKDIDRIPFPAYDLLPMNRYYLNSTRRLTNRKIGVILTGRGCPYRCTFCSRLFKTNVRLRSPENVIKEIKFLIKEYGVGEIHFLDDTFTFDKDRAIAICRLIRRNNLDIIWNCNSRVEHASDELYSELYSAGCRELFYGAESGSQHILDSLKKGISLAQTEKAVQLCKKHKMLVYCSFVYGSPEETKETLAETLAFARKLNPDFVVFCMLIPFPGTALFQEAVKRGFIDLRNVEWDQYMNLMSTDPPPVNMSVLSNEELIAWSKKAFRELYFNPRYVIKSIKRISSFTQVYELARGFMAVLSHQIWQFKSKVKG